MLEKIKAAAGAPAIVDRRKRLKLQDQPMTSVSSSSLSWPRPAVPGSEAMETVACLHGNNTTHCDRVDSEGLCVCVCVCEGGAVLLVGVSPVDNSSDIPAKHCGIMGPLFPGEYPLPPKQGIKPSGILGISDVTFRDVFRVIQLCCYCS